jgi:hypothetical protein
MTRAGRAALALAAQRYRLAEQAPPVKGRAPKASRT